MSAMHDAAERFSDAHDYDAKNCHILYLGDHDPSGLDMIRDIRERLAVFGEDVDVHPIALTMDQIEQYNPPPNPAKVTDPRAGDYIARHGRVSWELDALKPDVLHSLLRSELDDLIDMDMYAEIVEEEDADKAKLRDIVAREFSK